MNLSTLVPGGLSLHNSKTNKTKNLASASALLVILRDYELRFISLSQACIVFPSRPSHPPKPFHFSPPPREVELNTLDLGRPAGPPWHLEHLACCQCWRCCERLAGIMVFGWRSLCRVQIEEEAAKRRAEQRPGVCVHGALTCIHTQI